MFRRLGVAITAVLAVAVGAMVPDLAQARGGGGGGGGHAAFHAGGGGGHAAFHAGGGGGHFSAIHSGSMRLGHSGLMHLGHSGIHSLSYHGPKHSTLSHHGPKHSLSHTGKHSTLSHKSALNKTTHHDKSLSHHDKSLSHHDKSRTHHDKSLAHNDKSLAHHDKSLAHNDKSLHHDTLGKHHHHHHFFGRRVFAVWFGPIFWPYAFYDLFDYVFWTCDNYYYYTYGCYDYYGPFWAYGYDDLFGGIYWPYAYTGNYGYAGDRNRRRHVARNDPRDGAPQGARPDELAQLCGGEASSLVHFPFDRIAQRVQPTEAQRAGFEELKRAAADAADKLKASCPNESGAGPLGRLDTAEQRLDAMLDAVSTVRGPLTRFYDSLSDQQKARFDAMGLEPGREARAGRGGAPAAVVPRICNERTNAVAQLSIGEIEKTVQPTDAQRADLDRLRDASVRAADTIKASCPSETPLSATGRMEAVEARLSAMLDALKTVRGPLEKFYDSLSDEQRVRFNRMGQPTRRTG
jgi:LTXXQ motif family protein